MFFYGNNETEDKSNQMGDDSMVHYPKLNRVFITERLKQKLNEIDNHTITTVIAPMGFGKTTAINWWARRPVKSNSNAIFLRQIIVTDSLSDFWVGFCRIFKGYPKLKEQLISLGYPKDMGAACLLAEILSDALLANENPLYLIIDDVHLLGNNTLRPILILLSRSLPENTHLLLLSRNQIFIEEERMRLGNLLCEIGVEDLRLEKQEVALYARHCQLEIETKALMSLAELTEGWISMIYLNFKSYIQSGQWPSNSSDIYTLIDQVLLEHLADHQKEFLVLICMADEFTAKQASYLWKNDNAKALIDSLSKNNAFITKNENGV